MNPMVRAKDGTDLLQASVEQASRHRELTMDEALRSNE